MEGYYIVKCHFNEKDNETTILAESKKQAKYRLWRKFIDSGHRVNFIDFVRTCVTEVRRLPDTPW